MDQTTPILLVPGLASSARIYAPGDPGALAASAR